MKRLFLPLVFLIAATGFLLGGSIGATYFGRPIIQHQENYAYYSTNSTTDQHEPQSESFWVRTLNDPIAFYTFGLFLFTAFLAISTNGLWYQTRKLALGSDKQTEDMAKSIAEAARAAGAMEEIAQANRPWIVMSGFEGTGQLDAIVSGVQIKETTSFRFNFLNVGQSPAIKAWAFTAFKVVTDETIPHMEVIKSENMAQSVLGQGITFHTHEIAVSEVEHMQLITNKASVFLHAYFEYFGPNTGDKKFTTEACYKIRMAGHQTVNGKQVPRWTGTATGPQNSLS